MPKAGIFDVDGTLLDSVDLHALAWHEAMEKFGHDVSFEQARGQIGKGGDKMIPHFLTAEAQRDHGKEMEEWRGKRFKTEYLPLVRPFSAVPELLPKGPGKLLLRPHWKPKSNSAGSSVRVVPGPVPGQFFPLCPWP